MAEACPKGSVCTQREPFYPTKEWFARTRLKRFTLSALLAILAASPSFAQPPEATVQEKARFDAADETIEARQRVMRQLDEHLNALSETVRGSRDVALENEEVSGHVLMLQELSREIPGLFPQMPERLQSRAMPEIWESRDQFEEAARALSNDLRAFAEALNTGDAGQIRLSYRTLNVGASCAGCHSVFRKPEPDPTQLPQKKVQPDAPPR